MKKSGICFPTLYTLQHPYRFLEFGHQNKRQCKSVKGNTPSSRACKIYSNENCSDSEHFTYICVGAYHGRHYHFKRQGDSSLARFKYALNLLSESNGSSAYSPLKLDAGKKRTTLSWLKFLETLFCQWRTFL